MVAIPVEPLERLVIRVRGDLDRGVHEDLSGVELVADPLDDRADVISAGEHLVESGRSTPVFAGITVMERQHSVTSWQIIRVPMEVHAEFDDHVEFEIDHLAAGRCGDSLPDALPFGPERSYGGVRSDDRLPRYRSRPRGAHGGQTEQVVPEVLLRFSPHVRVVADIHAGNPKPACDRPLERCRLPPCDGGSIDEQTGRQAMQVTERIVGPRGLRRVMAHGG